MFERLDRRLATARGAGTAGAVAGLAALLALVGCASEQRNQQRQLKILVAALPGKYENGAQVEADTRAGLKPAHSPLALTVFKFKNGLIGENVLYVAETATGDSRRLIFQQVWVLAMGAKGKILQVIYRFRDPQRWRDILQQPEMFDALQFEDLQALSGCEVIWKVAGLGFAGENNRASCRRRDAGAAQADVVWQRLQLHGVELAIAEQRYNGSGQLVAGAETDPFYRFLRIESAAQ